jgi:hypothetical protein
MGRSMQRRAVLVGLLGLLGPGAVGEAAALQADGGAMTAGVGRGGAERIGAEAVVARAAELMGGEDALRGVRYVTLRMMTQWQRTGFRDVPFTDRPSFEPHVDLRDYALPAWRNTRDFGARTITNVVRDSIAVTDLGDGSRPLSVAYVDERDELFTYTPDRLIVALLDAPDLAAEADTTIGGERHRVVSATVSGRFPARVYVHAGIGLPSLLRFQAAHPADFGLVQWGEMDVEVWYSSWGTFGAIAIPRQWDVLRVGVPYKRMTVRSAIFDAEIAPDSFVIADELRDRYWASKAPLPMHEGIEVTGTSEAASGLMALQAGFGMPAGAVDTGDGWLILNAGQAPFNFDQAVDAFAAGGVEDLAGVLVAEARGGNGGVVRAAQQRRPILVSASAEPFVRTILRNAGVSDSVVDVVSARRTLGRGTERVVLEPIDLPDAPGSLLLFKPSIGWLFVPEGVDPLHVRMARERAHALGWSVEVVGTPRGIVSAGG